MIGTCAGIGDIEVTVGHAALELIDKKAKSTGWFAKEWRA